MIVVALNIMRSQEIPEPLSPLDHTEVVDWRAAAMVAIRHCQISSISWCVCVGGVCVCFLVCVYLFICNRDNSSASGHLFPPPINKTQSVKAEQGPNSACHISCYVPRVKCLSSWLITSPAHIMLALQNVTTQHHTTQLSSWQGTCTPFKLLSILPVHVGQIHNCPKNVLRWT